MASLDINSRTLIQPKQKRITRACDPCRRRKVKCDPDTSPGRPCQSCIDAFLVCSWTSEVKRRGRKRRVDELETRLQALERMLSLKTAESTPESENQHSGVDLDRPELVEEGEDDPDVEPLIERVSRLEIGSHDVAVWSLGNSSNRRTAQTVLQLGPHMKAATERPDIDSWEMEELQKSRTVIKPSFTFPPQDLLPVLIKAYFENINIHVPVLHGPTFQAAVSINRHQFDRNFAIVLLLVCANGSRYIEDPRVLLPGESKRSSGWAWFRQCEITKIDILAPQGLYTIQSYILAAFYTGGALQAHGPWFLPSIALRSMQELGVDRKRVYADTPQAVDEQWKRCFWICLYMDVTVASETGRPCILTDTSFDVTLPLECDDEYWSATDTQSAFKQPPEKVPRMAFFVHLCTLKLVHLKAMRTMFSPQLDVSTREEARSEIVFALDRWHEQTPLHLRWDLVHANSAFDEVSFIQASRLKLEFSHLSIIIHRPSISIRNFTTESAAALSLCIDAARSTSNVFQALSERAPSGSLASISMTYANSAIFILLLALWGARHIGMQVDEDAIERDIKNCLDSLLLSAPYFRYVQSSHESLTALVSRASQPPSGISSESQRQQTRSEEPQAAAGQWDTLAATQLSTASSVYTALDFSAPTSLEGSFGMGDTASSSWGYEFGTHNHELFSGFGGGSFFTTGEGSSLLDDQLFQEWSQAMEHSRTQ